MIQPYGGDKSQNPEARNLPNPYTAKVLNTRPIAIMKRKLDEDDVPTAADMDNASKKPSDFSALGLDPRLLQAVAQQNFSAPTLVQSRAIPLALEGKDILGTAI